jgi:carboxypeptidase C (cathepsin A)
VQTSLDTYTALQQFLTVKFPEFRQHKFFIAGESYAGVYVPTLAERIVAGNESFPINLEVTN